MSIGARLDDAMKKAGFESQSALSRASGVPQPTINRILKGSGTQGPEAGTVRKLAAACNVSFEWLNSGEESALRFSSAPPAGAMRVAPSSEDSSSRVRIPRVVEIRLSAGINQVAVEIDRREDGIYEIPRRWIEKHQFHPERLYAIEVKGESMEPNYYEGDIVVINVADRKLVSGHVYAVNVDGEPTLKRLVREGLTWWLYSDNDLPKYHKVSVKDADVEVIGKIVRRETEHVM